MVSQKHSDKVCFLGCHTYATVVDIGHFFHLGLNDNYNGGYARGSPEPDSEIHVCCHCKIRENIAVFTCRMHLVGEERKKEK